MTNQVKGSGMSKRDYGIQSDGEWPIIQDLRDLSGEQRDSATAHMLAECWDAAIEAHKAWTWDDENMEPLANPYRPTA